MTSPVFLSATEQSGLLAKKEISSVELVQAHLSRIDSQESRIHAFTEIFFERAIQDAQAADEARSRGETKGPLHGLPISIKESLEFAGCASTLGVSSRKAVRSHTDAALVSVFRDTGAIVLGRTNVSQLLIYHESRNPLFGQAANPFSLAHTPGGSSGGEAAAIASGMSPLGLGTDIGGSIRVPAAFSGICGLKPTLDRLPCKGSQSAMAGQEAIRGQTGPMARTTDDLILAMKSIDFNLASKLDPRVPPLPFTDPNTISLKGLRIGFYINDGWIPPSAAIGRAIDTAAQALKDAGCVLVPFTLPDPEGAIEIYFAGLGSDGGRTVQKVLEGSEIDPVIQSLLRMATLPPTLRNITISAVSALGEKRAARLLRVTNEKRISEYWQWTNKARNYRATLLDAWADANIDAVLCPVFATPALPHGFSKDFAIAGTPAMMYNLVQFPAGAVPVTRVQPSETLRNTHGDRFEKKAAAVDSQSSGLPVGVQLVARPWQESLVLALMNAVEKRVRGNSDFPNTPVTP